MQGSGLVISSLQNPRIKLLVELANKRAARQTAQVFTVEGAREIERARRCGFVLNELYYCRSALSALAASILAAAPQASSTGARTQTFEVSAAVFAKLAVREGSDGLVAVLKQRQWSLTALDLPPSPLLLGVQGIEKPGNLGALLRTADGAGVDAVILVDNTVDLYNPNVIRASLGAAFSVPVIAMTSDTLRAFAETRALQVYAAALTADAVPYDKVDLRGPALILLGEEAHGLSADWLTDQSSVRIKIPMHGITDSLNVAAAGAVLVYEAIRQRGSA